MPFSARCLYIVKGSDYDNDEESLYSNSVSVIYYAEMGVRSRLEETSFQKWRKLELLQNMVHKRENIAQEYILCSVKMQACSPSRNK